MTPTIVFTPRALDVIRQTAGSREPRAHDEATGGILIGKRAGDRIMILAATEPGPNPHDRRLGFGLDMDHANAVLQEWFDRDPDADIAGVWHTHPPDLAELTPEDAAAAYTLRDDAGREVVSAISLASPEGAAVTCFYLGAAATPPAAPVPARYAEGEDGAPVPALAAATLAERPDPSAHATPAASTSAPAAATPAPTPAASTSAPSRGRVLTAGLGVLLLLVVAAGLLRVFTAGESGGSATQSTSEAVSSVVAVVVQSTTALVAATATPTPAPTDTAAPSPTTAATASPTTAATASPTPVPATPTTAATATPEGPLPYLLRFEPMPAARRTTFLARARAADCATCYNVDLIGPQPYVELRVKIDDEDPPALRTFGVPSLVFVEPRDEPRTLQAFDLEGNPASPPISVEVVPNSYYILRIVAP